MLSACPVASSVDYAASGFSRTRNSVVVNLVSTSRHLSDADRVHKHICLPNKNLIIRNGLCRGGTRSDNFQTVKQLQNSCTAPRFRTDQVLILHIWLRG